MSASEWFAVDVVVDVDATEAVESAFNHNNCLGIETDTWKISPGVPLRVSGYFDQLPDLTKIEITVKNELEIYGFAAGSLKGISHRTIEQTDWLAEWKKHWKPVEVGGFIIAPPWADVPDTDKHIIRIEPNMAFGTGTHETTQLCLRSISHLLRSGQSFLDVGTGTGILAIAAANLGAGPVVGCDTDADSIRIARENAVANGVDDKVDFLCGSIDDATQTFDFVCANLTLDVIVPMLPLLIDKSRNILLLSGILAEQESHMRAHLLQSGISTFKFEIGGEWLSVLIGK